MRVRPQASETPMGTRVLSPYYCTATHPRTRLPCNTVLIEAWSAAGAVVRRRCKQCGTWAVVEVEGTPSASDEAPQNCAYSPRMDPVLH